MFVQLILFLLVIAAIFIPTFIAYHRKLKRRFACLIVNLLFGWIILVWVPLVIWTALSNATE